MEIIIVSFTLPVFTALFNLNAAAQGLLASPVLIGDIVGAVVFGKFSDTMGRRPVFQISLLWYSVFAALTALAQSYRHVAAFRFLAGIGLGGMLVVDPTPLYLCA